LAAPSLAVAMPSEAAKTP
jgi:hypothetical protein